MLNIIMLNVIMQSVILLNVIILGVMAPKNNVLEKTTGPML
jgi:hypothetical protein